MSKGEFGESEFQKYQIKRKDALIVEAVRFDAEKTWPSCVISWKESRFSQPRDTSWGFVPSTHGYLHVMDGDWIVKECDDFHLFKPHIFRARYVKVEIDDRESQCVRACDGIKDPEKTIPKLVQLAKEITYASNEVSGCFLRDAIEALEGVSDE